MRVCATCGREVPEAGARFCGFCGAPMPDAPTQPVETGGVQHRRPDEVAAPVARPVSQPTDTIATRLDPATIATDPGGTATITLRVRNTGTVVDELRIVVEGPVAPWAEVEPTVLRLMPGTDGAASIRFRPPRIPLALAGPMGFVVRVHSHEHPQEPAMESGVLTVGEVRALGGGGRPGHGQVARRPRLRDPRREPGQRPDRRHGDRERPRRGAPARPRPRRPAHPARRAPGGSACA